MSAILKEDPQELGSSVKGLSPAIERVVRRCLEEVGSSGSSRRATSRFALDAVSSVTSAEHAPLPAAAPAAGRRVGWSAAIALGIVVAAVAAGAACAVVGA